MAGFAQTIIIGNVGRDPEMRYLQNGTPVCSFSVAVSRRWNDKNSNEQKEKTVWYRVSCWRQLAETANNYVHKGMQIMVQGELEPARAYLDNAGQPAASLELTAQNFQFLGQRGDNQGGGQGGDYNDNYANQGQGASNVDDIPF
ncbi:MAG TPA: single-stranded DNA-binding protein [Phototrophicaceae bacterium]|nr:single-stranded DNA-binding protein [Phototrophicaceae bacterium]